MCKLDEEEPNYGSMLCNGSVTTIQYGCNLDEGVALLGKEFAACEQDGPLGCFCTNILHGLEPNAGAT